MAYSSPGPTLHCWRDLQQDQERGVLEKQEATWVKRPPYKQVILTALPAWTLVKAVAQALGPRAQ